MLCKLKQAISTISLEIARMQLVFIISFIFTAYVFETNQTKQIVMRKISFIMMFCLIALSAIGQNKKALTIEDYDIWNELDNESISFNGNYITFEVNPHVGDGTLYVKDAKGKLVAAIERGYDAEFTATSEYLVCKIKPQHAKVRQAKLDDVKKDKMPKDSLALVELTTGEVTKFENVKSFELPEEGGNLLAFVQEVKDTSDKKSKFEKYLKVINLDNGNELSFQHIEDYAWSKFNDVLLFTTLIDSVDLAKVFIINADFNANTLLSKEGEVKSLEISDQGDKAAFLFSDDTTDTKVFELYYTGAINTEAQVLINENTSGMPAGYAVSEHGNVYFSESGNRLFFGTYTKPVEEPEDTLTDDEKVIVDIWSWTDKRLQPMQKVQLNREQKKNYDAVYLIDKKKMLQLQDESIDYMSMLEEGDGSIAIGIAREPYMRSSSWDNPSYQDIYKVDMLTGEKTLLLKKHQGRFTTSPKGKYLVYYNMEERVWYAMSTTSKYVTNLTGKINVNFYDEDHDYPAHPSSYGYAEFTEDERFILILDRYDFWKFDLSGKEEPVNITNGFGRKNKMRLDYRDLDLDTDFITEKETLLLHGFDETTKKHAFYSFTAKKPNDPKLLFTGEYQLRFRAKAKNADMFIWDKENYNVFPDLLVSNSKFTSPVRLSDANPQQKDYKWGDVELYTWTDFNGNKVEGLLYKPENFDPNKKYPMMVTFYRLESQDLYNHYIHFPHRSVVIPNLYTSNDYLVFKPDVHYEIGYPGKSCYDNVVSGVMALIQEGFVDKDAIGIQGQSWGGYQVSYLVTQTDIFAAAMAGAPVVNMFSAYGGIRWETGMSRMFQYEKTQSRIGGTMWEKPVEYFLNSPIFFAEKVNTPLLIRHDDADGAVPWYQGIEYFVALRRLDKPVWMLNYNDEPHNLVRWPNKVDMQKRFFQFFNHYLKGEPMPVWMKDGIPMIEKGKTMGYEYAE